MKFKRLLISRCSEKYNFTIIRKLLLISGCLESYFQDDHMIKNFISLLFQINLSTCI